MTRVYGAIGTSILVWSLAFLVIRTALAQLKPAELALLRFIPVALLCGIFAAIKFRKETTRILREDRGALIMMSMLLIPFYNWCLYLGQQKVSPGLAALMIGSSPAVTYVMAFSIGQEKFLWPKMGGILLAFAGLLIAIVLGSERGLEASGWAYVLAVFGATMSASSYSIMARSLLFKYDPVPLMCLVMVTGTVPLLIAGGPEFWGKLVLLSGKTWVSIGYLSLIATLGGFYSWFYALKRLPASNVVIFANLIPFLTMLFGYVFYGEHITAWLIAGGVLIALGVYQTTRKIA
ncbi:MAG: DMT family transporter [Elusimicrobia bacterium]|nr:DMT family transporter [Elusimicrobiota bacterium]